MVPAYRVRAQRPFPCVAKSRLILGARGRLGRPVAAALTREADNEHDHHQRRHPDLLQRLGQGPARRLQPRLAVERDSWESRCSSSPAGYRCIAHDRRGHGRSSQPWRGNDMDTYADDLAQLIEKLDLKHACSWAFPPVAARSHATSVAMAQIA